MAGAVHRAARDLCGDGTEPTPTFDLVSAAAVISVAAESFEQRIIQTRRRVEAIRATPMRRGASERPFKERLDMIDVTLIAAEERLAKIDQSAVEPTPEAVASFVGELAGIATMLSLMVGYSEEIGYGANEIANHSKPRHRDPTATRACKVRDVRRALDDFQISPSHSNRRAAELLESKLTGAKGELPYASLYKSNGDALTAPTLADLMTGWRASAKKAP